MAFSTIAPAAQPPEQPTGATPSRVPTGTPNPGPLGTLGTLSTLGTFDAQGALDTRSTLNTWKYLLLPAPFFLALPIHLPHIDDSLTHVTFKLGSAAVAVAFKLSALTVLVSEALKALILDPNKSPQLPLDCSYK